MKTEFDVAIIGAGPNGLICAGYLARAGLSVALMEARHETGGGLDTLEFAGFRHNPHAIYQMMAELMPPWNDFNLQQRGVRFIRPEVQAAFVEPGKAPLVFYSDSRKTADFIAKHFSQKDADGFARMYADFSEFCEKILLPLTFVPAVPPLEQVQTLISAKDDVGKRFNDVAELTPMEILDLYNLSEPIKSAVLHLYTMWGFSPFEALGYIFPLYVVRMTQAAIVSGGSHRLSSAMHKAVIEAGGEIHDSSPVSRVIMENSRAAGVVLKDGTRIRARAVASTVDPRQNFLEFFNKGQLPNDLTESAKNWQWEKSTLFTLHAGLAEAPVYTGSDIAPDVNRALITFMGMPDSESLAAHIDSVEAGELPDPPMGHATCASLFDPIQAPPGNHTGRYECLVPFDADWDAIKDEYAEKCLTQWRKYAPNVAPLCTLSYPPNYIELKMKNMVRGSIKQGAYSPLQMGYSRPNPYCSQCWTPIEGFFVCGASVYPGGMIIGGPGYIGANVIAQELKVKITWEEPEMVKKAREAGLVAEL